MLTKMSETIERVLQYGNPRYHDVWFLTQNVTFLANRAIIAECCPWFDTLFQSHPHKEIELDGFSSVALQATLDFIYHGQLPPETARLIETLELATKVCFKKLRDTIILHLKRKVMDDFDGVSRALETRWPGTQLRTDPNCPGYELACYLDFVQSQRQYAASHPHPQLPYFRTDRELEFLNAVLSPVWLFDIEHLTMHWANTAALELWSADSLESLLARDWSGDMSEATKVRLANYAVRMLQGEIISGEQWTFYPMPTRRPRVVTTASRGVLVGPEPGRMVMLIEAVSAGTTQVAPMVLRAVEALTHTYTMVTLYSSADLSPLYQNPAALRTAAGSTAGQTLAQRFADPRDFADCMKTLAENQVFEREVRMNTARGPQWHSTAVRRTRDPVSGDEAILVNEVDISARKALERSNSNKDRFLHTVSHEIRTPIAGILGFNTLLLESEGLSPEHRMFAESIQESCKLLLAQVNDLLDVAKMADGKLLLEHVVVDIREIVDSLAVLSRPQAAAKNLRLETNVDPAVPSVLFGDPVRIKQILLNFTSNAFKFTHSGGVRISVQFDQQNSNDRECCLRLSVVDTGVGVPAAIQQKIFHRFVQADSSTARKYGGTGLGLSICKHLAQLMGGTCGVISPIPNAPSGVVGSEFYATIRLARRYDRPPGCPQQVLLVVAPEGGSRAMAKSHRQLLEVGSMCCSEVHVAEDIAAAKNWLHSVTEVGMESQLHRVAHEHKEIVVVVCKMTFSGFEESPDITQEYYDALEMPTFPPDGSNPPRICIVDQNSEAVQDFLNAIIFGRPPQPNASASPNPTPNDLETPNGRKNAATPAESPNFSNHNPGKVLVIEDNPVNQRLLNSILRKLGIETDTVPDGLAAMKHLETNPLSQYIMVLLDIMMPNMDGFECATRIRSLQDPNARDIPIIGISASPPAAIFQKCIESGMNDLLSKPFKVQDLRKVIFRQAPIRRRYLSSNSTTVR